MRSLSPSSGSAKLAKPRVRILARGVGLERTGRIVHAALWHAHLHVAVALEVHDRALGRVDRDLLEVGTAETGDLGVEIGEDAALQQRIVGEVDAGHDVAWRRRRPVRFRRRSCRRCDRAPCVPTTRSGQDFFRDELGRVENVEVEVVGELFVEELDGRAPTRGSCRCRWRSTDRGGGSRDRRR